MDEARFETSTSLPVPASVLDRRKIPRRAEDRRCVVLAKVAKVLVDTVRQPQVIFDEQLVVLLVNKAMKRLLASTDEILISSKKLSIKNESCRAELRRVILGEAEGGSFAVDVSGRSVLICIRALYLSKAFGRLLMMNSEEPRCDQVHIEKIFGLTRAESEIALSIHRGLSLVSISKQRGVSINTVKTQAHCIFQKCGVRSQMELARRLTELQLSPAMTFKDPQYVRRERRECGLPTPIAHEAVQGERT